MSTCRRLYAIAAGAMLMAGPFGAMPAEAQTKTVFLTNTTPIVALSGQPTAQPANPYPSTVSAGLRRARIKDVNVTLNGLQHNFVDDLDVLLVAPNGSRAVVMSDVGGGAMAGAATITLDDEAAAPLPDNGPLTSGSFQPTDSETEFLPPAPPTTRLSVFDRSRPTGQWKLFVMDDGPSNGGQIGGGWTLQLTVRIP